MWNLTKFAAVLLLAQALPAPPPPPSAPRPLDDAEAYKVYAAVLPKRSTVAVAGARTFVFQQETQPNWQCMPSGRPLETTWKDVFIDFQRANARTWLLQPGFNLGVSYIVLPKAEIRAIFKPGPEASTSVGMISTRSIPIRAVT